jgi:hypothetical protein
MLLLAWAVLTLSAAESGAADPSSAPKQPLQAAAADPTWPLIQVTLDYDLAVTNRGGSGSAHRLLFQPVIPLAPFKGFPVGQIIRPSLPLISSPGPDRATGLGDLTIFDVFLPRRHSWGALGAGPVVVFPTATDDRLGQGKWQIGPAAAVIYQAIPNVQIGVILQNPISFAGTTSPTGGTCRWVTSPGPSIGSTAAMRRSHWPSRPGACSRSSASSGI